MKGFNQSCWEKNSFPEYTSITTDEIGDVCVIGGGITGLTTALLLQRKGFKVVLLERGRIGSGTTGHTTGHVTSAIDFYYHRLIKYYGTETSREILMETIKARKLIENNIQTYNITEAGYEKVPVTYFADGTNQMDTFFKERDAFEQLGVPVESNPTWKIKGELTNFMIHGQGKMDGLGYVHGLAKAFREAGGRIFENSPVLDFTMVRDKWHVKVAGHFAVADHLVQATHTPLGINPVHVEMIPHNSYVMVVKPTTPVQKGLFYDFESPYHYIRDVEVDGELCYMVGGFDNKSGKKNSQVKQLAKLRAYIEDKFGIEKVLYEWSDMFFEPANELPFIGRTPFGKNSYIACGFSGDGLTFGTISGMIISTQIAEGKHHMEKIFSPSRVEFNAIPYILRENLNTIQNFIGKRIQLGKDKLKNLEVGKGIVVKIENQAVGVSQDEEGNIHGVIPVCPHMKCIVQWNDQGRSWDCGCHGSRFDADGKVIAGPSMTSLPPISIDVLQETYIRKSDSLE
jgi:glycine/D-amino acid oxidase-like deaminating enzyme/nitrite reductase/ring-hydroxylating ferredoxin subunit